MGHPVTTFSTRFGRRCTHGPMPPEGVLLCRIPSLTLAEETYAMDLWLAYRGGLADYVVRAGQLRVVSGNFYPSGQEPVKRKHGAALISHEWLVEPLTDDDEVAATVVRA
jgi:hypothetical protein